MVSAAASKSDTTPNDLACAIICWTLPYIFALKVGDLSTFEATAMKALIPVTIVIAIVGVVATVMDMVNKIGDQKGAPFGCSTG